MRFKLTAKDKITKKDVTLQWFDDENMFDTMLDTVDPEIYQDAMILELQNRVEKELIRKKNR